MGDIEGIRKRLVRGREGCGECGRAVDNGEVATLLSELDKRDELLRECRAHMQHIGTCRQNIIGGYDYPCTCGLTELLEKLK